MKVIKLVIATFCISLPVFANDCQIPPGTYRADLHNLIDYHIAVSVRSLEASIHIPEENTDYSLTVFVAPAAGRSEVYEITQGTRTIRAKEYSGAAVGEAKVQCNDETIHFHFGPVLKSGEKSWFEGKKTLLGNITLHYQANDKTLVAEGEECLLQRFDYPRHSKFIVNSPIKHNLQKCIFKELKYLQREPDDTE